MSNIYSTMKPGDNRIIDLHQYGRKFYTEVMDAIAYQKNYNDSFQWAIQQVYETVVRDVVRLISEDNDLAMELIKYLPRAQEIKDVILAIGFDEYNALHQICQQAALNLYVIIKQQLVSSGSVHFIPIIINTDYLVVQEIKLT